MVPLANAPTWVKALWVEKELQERGLWQDDVFELVRPFLVTPKGSGEPAAISPPPEPVPLPEQVDLGSQIVVSTPQQTPAEARWAPSPDGPDDEELSDEDNPGDFGADSGLVKTPSEYLKSVGYDAVSASSDGVDDEADHSPPDTGPDAGSPSPAPKQSDASLNNSSDEEIARRISELTPEQAELASVIHMLAVSARLGDAPSREEPQAQDFQPPEPDSEVDQDPGEFRASDSPIVTDIDAVEAESSASTQAAAPDEADDAEQSEDGDSSKLDRPGIVPFLEWHDDTVDLSSELTGNAQIDEIEPELPAEPVSEISDHAGEGEAPEETVQASEDSDEQGDPGHRMPGMAPFSGWLKAAEGQPVDLPLHEPEIEIEAEIPAEPVAQLSGPATDQTAEEKPEISDSSDDTVVAGSIETTQPKQGLELTFWHTKPVQPPVESEKIDLADEQIPQTSEASDNPEIPDSSESKQPKKGLEVTYWRTKPVQPPVESDSVDLANEQISEASEASDNPEIPDGSESKQPKPWLEVTYWHTKPVQPPVEPEKIDQPAEEHPEASEASDNPEIPDSSKSKQPKPGLEVTYWRTKPVQPPVEPESVDLPKVDESNQKPSRSPDLGSGTSDPTVEGHLTVSPPVAEAKTGQVDLPEPAQKPTTASSEKSSEAVLDNRPAPSRNALTRHLTAAETAADRQPFPAGSKGTVTPSNQVPEPVTTQRIAEPVHEDAATAETLPELEPAKEQQRPSKTTAKKRSVRKSRKSRKPRKAATASKRDPKPSTAEPGERGNTLVNAELRRQPTAIAPVVPTLKPAEDQRKVDTVPAAAIAPDPASVKTSSTEASPSKSQPVAKQTKPNRTASKKSSPKASTKSKPSTARVKKPKTEIISDQPGLKKGAGTLVDALPGTLPTTLEIVVAPAEKPKNKFPSSPTPEHVKREAGPKAPLPVSSKRASSAKSEKAASKPVKKSLAAQSQKQEKSKKSPTSPISLPPAKIDSKSATLTDKSPASLSQKQEKSKKSPTGPISVPPAKTDSKASTPVKKSLTVPSSKRDKSKPSSSAPTAPPASRPVAKPVAKTDPKPKKLKQKDPVTQSPKQDKPEKASATSRSTTSTSVPAAKIEQNAQPSKQKSAPAASLKPAKRKSPRKPSTPPAISTSVTPVKVAKSAQKPERSKSTRLKIPAEAVAKSRPARKPRTATGKARRGLSEPTARKLRKLASQPVVQPKKDLLNNIDAAAIADLFGIHIDTTSGSDHTRLLFFDAALKAQNGDWTGSQERLEAALKSVGNSPRSWVMRSAIEQAIKINERLNRPAA